jgi:hypothetical protein
VGHNYSLQVFHHAEIQTQHTFVVFELRGTHMLRSPNGEPAMIPKLPELKARPTASTTSSEQRDLGL